MRESSQPPTATTSQVDLLAHDLAEYSRVIDENPTAFAPVADFTEPSRHARPMVVCDVFYRICDLIIGLHALIVAEVRAPANIIGRALLEAMGNLAYLANHEDSEREALIWIAYSSLELLKFFPDQTDLVADHESILARLPADVVAIARERRKKRPYTWSGRTFRQVAEQAKLFGYDTFYSVLSQEVHSGTVGEHFRVLRADNPRQVKLHAGQEFTASARETMANFARRALRDSFTIVWGVLDAPPVEIHSLDPRTWRASPQLNE